MRWSTPRSGVTARGSKATGCGSRASLVPIHAACRSANSRAAFSEERDGMVSNTSRVAVRTLNVKRREAATRLSATR